MFFEKKFSKSSEFYYLELGLYPSITDIVEALNTLLQERHNHRENCITVKVSRRTHKVEINLQMKEVTLHSLAWTWDTFSEVMLVKSLEKS